ncbi:STAS/SEC14 domain-containing protein [Microbacter sp. GSS18]|nr:STAS/SEC14 domain-containing protein [Microbacter sp. GSS18]
MIEQIPDLPDGVLGFRAVGAVSSDDYRSVMDPAIDAAVAAHQRLNIVFVFGDDFERYTLGGMWQDAMLDHEPRQAWGRIALVTDHSLIAEIVHGLAFLFPGEVKFFPTSGERDAVAWAAGGPVWA